MNTSMLTEKDSTIQLEEGFVETSCASIWYKKFYTEASKAKTPLVCLHGGPGGSLVHLQLLQELAPLQPIVLYDQSGCGNSTLKDPQFSDWTLSHYLKELHEVINALGYHKVDLLGHSWGGMLATKFTLEHPEIVEQLLLSSPLISSPQWMRDCKRLATSLSPELSATLLDNEAAGTTDGLEYKQAMKTFYDNFFCRSQSLLDAFSASTNKFNYHIYVTMWGPYESTATGNLKEVDLSSELGKIKVPVLIICGRYDMATPESMQLYAQELPDARVVVLEKSAHLSPLEEPENFIGAVRDFLLQE